MRLLHNIFKNHDVDIETSYYMHSGENSATGIKTINKTENSYEETVDSKTNDVLKQAKEDAFKIIDEAKEHANRIKSLASVKIKMDMEAAEKVSYEKGLSLGKEDALVRNQEKLDEISSLLKSLDEQKAQILKDAENEMIDLALEIANKLIGVQLDKNEGTLINIYKKAVQDFQNQEWVRVSVSEAEIDFATQNAELLRSLVRGAKYIDIIKLSDAPKGTCIVETPKGIANASIDVQINKIKEAFLKVEMSSAM